MTISLGNALSESLTTGVAVGAEASSVPGVSLGTAADWDGAFQPIALGTAADWDGAFQPIVKP
jgi:hypothetical protein